MIFIEFVTRFETPLVPSLYFCLILNFLCPIWKAFRFWKYYQSPGIRVHQSHRNPDNGGHYTTTGLENKLFNAVIYYYYCEAFTYKVFGLNMCILGNNCIWRRAHG